MTAGPAARTELAGLARRLLSLAYEVLLLAALLLAGGLCFTLATAGVEPALVRPALQAFLTLLSAAYFVWQWCHGGQTLPMKTWRIRLVTTAGCPVTPRRATLRFLIALAGTLLFGAGFLAALLDPDGQFLHDRLAGTRIIKDGG